MIETRRLKIFPFSHAQLVKYIKCDPLLEVELNLAPVQRNFSAELAEALETFILPRVANEKNDLRYVTLWGIILKNERVAVGDLCFKGEPDEKGEIEIGYGTYENFRGNGYMKEAVGGMVEWASQQKGLRAMIAETETTNPASLKILEDNGFAVFKELGDSIWLRRVLKRRS